MIDGGAVSPDGKLIASHGIGDAVRVWDAKTGKPVRQFPTGAWGSHALAFSPDSKQLAMATQIVLTDDSNPLEKRTGTFVCWDLKTGRERNRSDGLNGVRPGNRSRNALIWPANGELRVAEMLGGSLAKYNPFDPAPAFGLLALTKQIGAVTFHPDGKRCGGVYDDGTVEVWDMDAGNVVTWLPPAAVKSGSRDYSSAVLAFTSDGKTLVLSLPE